MIRIFAAVFALFLLISCGSDEEQLKIRRDIANLQEKIYEVERSQTEIREDLRNAVSQVERRIQDRADEAKLQDQIRTLRETLAQYEARLNDLDNKIEDVSRARSQVATAPIQPTDTGDTPPPIESVSGEVVEQQFNKAYLDYNRGKYDVAGQGFKGILENFPGSPFTEPALYYLGRSYLENKDYQAAVEQFRTITQKYPQGDFIKQAIYYEGQCYYYLNQYSRAVLALEDLKRRFPGTQEAELASQFLRKAGFEK